MSKKIKKSSVKKAKPAKNAKKPANNAKKTAVKSKPAKKSNIKAKTAPAKKAAPVKVTKLSAKTLNPKRAKEKLPIKEKVKKVEPVKAKKTAAPAAPVKKAETAPKSKTETKAKNSSAKQSNSNGTPQNKSAENLKPLASLKTIAKTINQEDSKPGNEPAGKFELEYVVHSSAELLFNFLTEPSGLSEWFCDDVNIRHGVYSFLWDGSQQQAKVLKMIPDKLVRLQWLDKTDGSYFEFRIEKDDLTSDISLLITDFADTAEERTSSKLLWDSQIDKLLHVMGAYF